MKEKNSVKLKDIARELNVSIVSVSNALSGRKGVSQELREKVKEKAEEMGYKIPMYQPKKQIKTCYIGVMISERYIKEFPSFYMEVYKQVAQIATKRDCLTLLDVVDIEREEMRRFSSLFANMGVDGILIIGDMNLSFIREVKSRTNIPMVGLDFYDVSEKMDYIVTDSFHGMKEVTQRLIDAGYRDIAFLGNPNATNSIMDRYMGYCKALAVNGIEEREDRVIFDRSEENYKIEFELPENLPEAFAVNCDRSACILIEKLQKKGISIPEDIAIVSFDHLHEQSLEYNLVTYENDGRLLAQNGVDVLLKRIRRKGKNESEEHIEIIKGKVIEGNTIGKGAAK